MPKRALDEDGSSGEAASILPEPVDSICSTELGDGRKDDEVDEDDNDGDRSECSAVMESSASDDTSLPTDGSTDTGEPCCTDDCGRRAKNPVKKSVSFDDVTVYYFPRVQGFTCVPSQGGSTLGMGDRHTTVEKYSLSEHADLRRSLHHKVLLEHQRQGRIFLPENFSSELMVTAGEWALDEYYFLQPVPARQRRVMLHNAGIARIDPTEREECRSLRVSRSRCGCSCREVCRPPSCLCCRSGIGCQVDQMAFPCSCSRNGCANPHGRIEFNAARVRGHFIRTLLQLGLEQNSAAEYECSLPPPAKRCRFDNDQPTSSSSSSSFPFALPSSASSLVNSSCSDTTANALEPQTVYFDSVDRLPGPETMILAYDEDCNDEDDEDSSETSSEGDGSFDGLLDNDHDPETASTVHDSRQRTLDNYVIRFSRAHTHTNPGPSHVSVSSLPTGVQCGTTAQSLQRPITADTTTGCKVPHSTSQVYHMADGSETTDHCYTQRYTLDNCHVSVATTTTTTTTHSYYYTDSAVFESNDCRPHTTDHPMPPACDEAIGTSSTEAVSVASDDSIQQEAKETSSTQAVYVALDNDAHQTAVETNSVYVTPADSVYEETTETDYTQAVSVALDDSIQQDAKESTVTQPVCIPSAPSVHQEAVENSLSQTVHVTSSINMQQEAKVLTISQPVYVEDIQEEAIDISCTQPVSEAVACSTRSDPTSVVFPPADNDRSASVDCVSQSFTMSENTNSDCSRAEDVPDFSLAECCNSAGSTWPQKLMRTSDLTSNDCTDGNSLPADEFIVSHTADNVIRSNSLSYNAKSSEMNNAFEQVRDNSEMSSDEKEADVELTDGVVEVPLTTTEDIDCVDTSDTAGQVTVDYCDRTSSDDVNVGDL